MYQELGTRILLYTTTRADLLGPTAPHPLAFCQIRKVRPGRARTLDQSTMVYRYSVTICYCNLAARNG